MKKRILTVLLLAGASFTALQAQSFDQLLKDLKLPVYHINDKPVKEQTIEGHDGITIENVKIDNNDIFQKVILQYNELDELNLITFEIKKNKLKKKLPFILQTLVKNLGKEDHIQPAQNPSVSGRKVFIKENSQVILQSSDNDIPLPTLSFSLVDDVKIKETYDEFSKKTRLTIVNSDGKLISKNKLDYKIRFSGTLGGDEVFMNIFSDSEEWKAMKSILILLDDGRVIDYPVFSREEAVQDAAGNKKTIEKAVTSFSKELCDLLIKSKSIRMRIIGENKTGDVTLSPDLIKSLNLVYQKMYNI